LSALQSLAAERELGDKGSGGLLRNVSSGCSCGFAVSTGEYTNGKQVTTQFVYSHFIFVP
jgi:hypothetical protein